MGEHTVSRRSEEPSRSRIAVLTAVSLVMLLLTLGTLLGCGGGSPATSQTSGSAAAGSPQVLMQNTKFVPATITVKVGQSITWVNEDATQHDVVAKNGEFKSALLKQGQTFSFAFTKAGSFPYYCSIHPQMTGTVTVAP